MTYLCRENLSFGMGDVLANFFSVLVPNNKGIGINHIYIH